MKIEIEVSEDLSPDACGEVLLELISEPSERWGYTTHKFRQEDWIENLDIDINKELLEATLCCGCFAKEDWSLISKHINNSLRLIVYLYWDGDGTIVIKHMDEGWILYNSDMKKDYGWEWAGSDCWVNDLSEDYYETYKKCDE